MYVFLYAVSELIFHGVQNNFFWVCSFLMKCQNLRLLKFLPSKIRSAVQECQPEPNGPGSPLPSEFSHGIPPLAASFPLQKHPPPAQTSSVPHSRVHPSSTGINCHAAWFLAAVAPRPSTPTVLHGECPGPDAAPWGCSWSARGSARRIGAAVPDGERLARRKTGCPGHASRWARERFWRSVGRDPASRLDSLFSCRRNFEKEFSKKRNKQSVYIFFPTGKKTTKITVKLKQILMHEVGSYGKMCKIFWHSITSWRI